MARLSLRSGPQDHVVAGARQRLLLAGQFHIVLGHDLYEFFEADTGLPAEVGPSLGSISTEEVHLGRTQIARVGDRVAGPIDTAKVRGPVPTFANGMGPPPRAHAIVGGAPPQPQPPVFPPIPRASPNAAPIQASPPTR